MANDPSLIKPALAIRANANTIGDLEHLAGVGPSHAERFEFWRQFSHLKDHAFNAGRAELYRRITARENERNPLP